MKRLMHRATLLVATTLLCAVGLPLTATPANAAWHIQTLCDNVDNVPGVIPDLDVVLLTGELFVHLATAQDSNVKYEDTSGNVFDALVGVDVGPAAGFGPVVVCVRLPGPVNLFLIINDPTQPAPVEVCEWLAPGEPVEGTYTCIP